MNSETNALNILRELELEVEAEGREWMRRRLAEKLQAQVDKDGASRCNCARPSASSR